MNVAIFGAAGFIGTNLAIQLSRKHHLVLVDKYDEYFSNIKKLGLANAEIFISSLDENTDFSVLSGQDVVYHLVCSSSPSTSNQDILPYLQSDIAFSTKLLEACSKYKVKKIIFISSGGTIYGLESACPIPESSPTLPICSYGFQKLTIEKLISLFHYMNNLDYKIIRLANPYGPYQRPNGILGAITTFIYRALTNQTIKVYGDGSTVRDFIYIDDAIRGVINIAHKESKFHIFNLGTGHGTSLLQILACIEHTLGLELDVVHMPRRSVDVPVNYLDIQRYEHCFGRFRTTSLEEGIRKCAEYLKSNYIGKESLSTLGH